MSARRRHLAFPQAGTTEEAGLGTTSKSATINEDAKRGRRTEEWIALCKQFSRIPGLCCSGQIASPQPSGKTCNRRYPGIQRIPRGRGEHYRPESDDMRSRKRRGHRASTPGRARQELRYHLIICMQQRALEASALLCCRHIVSEGDGGHGSRRDIAPYTSRPYCSRQASTLYSVTRIDLS